MALTVPVEDANHPLGSLECSVPAGGARWAAKSSHVKCVLFMRCGAVLILGLDLGVADRCDMVLDAR